MTKARRILDGTGRIELTTVEGQKFVLHHSAAEELLGALSELWHSPDLEIVVVGGPMRSFLTRRS